MSDELFFRMRLAADLTDHPEWLASALSGISAGMAGALAKANERAGRYDMAFRSALSLADNGRLSAETKALLNRAIVAAIDPKTASEVEREALRRAAESPEKEERR